MDLSTTITPDRWRFTGVCYCDGPLEQKYEYITNPDIRLRIKPDVRLFKLFDSEGGVFDEPLSLLVSTLKENGLI